MKLFLSPHNDDAVLFGAWTILREKPLVVTVFDSHVQAARGTGITAERRREEDREAMQILGASIRFLGFSDAVRYSAQEIENCLKAFESPEMVYAPAPEEGGHAQHNLVGEIAKRVFRNVTLYTTYTKAGKSRGSVEVLPEKGEWIAAKLRAMACYTSQHAIDSRIGCWPHFTRDLAEYYL